MAISSAFERTCISYRIVEKAGIKSHRLEEKKTLRRIAKRKARLQINGEKDQVEVEKTSLGPDSQNNFRKNPKFIISFS